LNNIAREAKGEDLALDALLAVNTCSARQSALGNELKFSLARRLTAWRV
jgi:hypothetical protein